METEGTIRKHIVISKELDNLIRERSKKSGMTQNAVIVNAVQQYFDQQEALKNMGSINSWLEKLQDIKEDIGK